MVSLICTSIAYWSDEWQALEIISFSADNLRITAGEHSLSQVDSLEQSSFVLKYKIHEYYNSFNFENDIALLFVSL